LGARSTCPPHKLSMKRGVSHSEGRVRGGVIAADPLPDLVCGLVWVLKPAVWAGAVDGRWEILGKDL
jgi:hypothetical protein